MTFKLFLCARGRVPLRAVLCSVFLLCASFHSQAQTTVKRARAAADSLAVAVNNVAIAGEYSLRGFTANFAFPVLSMISVTDDSGNVVPGLADTLRWLGRNDNVESGAPISQIWQPLLEYHRDRPAFPPDANIYNQPSGPFFTEVRKTVPFPTSTMLVMDVSGSMQDALADAKIANHVYVDLLRPVDRAGIIQFDNRIVRTQSMTSDKAQLKAVIEAAEPAGATAIYNALLLAIQETKREIRRRRAIILYTDGFDNASDSTSTVAAVIDSARAYGIPIFTISLGDFTSETDLKKIAVETGGLFFKSPTAKEMQRIYRRLSDIIQNFYMMAHGSTDPVRNNTWRLVDVTTNVASRHGRGLGHYFVPSVTPPMPVDIAFAFTSLTDTGIVVNGKNYNAVRPGEIYAYRLVVRNRGNAAANEVRVSQFLPDSVRLLDSSQPLLFTDGDSLVWQIDRLNPGAADSIIAAVQLAAQIPPALRELVSRGRMFAANDISPQDNSASDTVKIITTPPPPLHTDLAVFQRAQTDSFAVSGNDTLRFAAPAETYFYQITVRNASGVAAQNVIVKDFLPDSIRAHGFQPAPDLMTTDSLQWQLGILPAKSQITLRFNATVAGKMPAGTNVLINKIIAVADNEAENSRADNVASDTVYNLVKPLPPSNATDVALAFISKTDTSIIENGQAFNAVRPGEAYEYRLLLRNLGPAAAQNIRVSQTLPDSVRVLGASLPLLSVTADSVVWLINRLAPGQIDSITLQVKLAAQIPNTLRELASRARFFVANDTSAANNSAADTVRVLFAPPPPLQTDIAVFQRADTDSFVVVGSDTVRFARPNETYIYEITVRNLGNVAAQKLVVTDFLPDSVRASNFQPQPNLIASDSLRLQINSLLPLSATRFRFSATVANRMPAGTNLLINHVRLRADNEDPAQLSNNVAIDTVYNFVKPPPPSNATDLALAFSAVTDTNIIVDGRLVRAAKPGQEYEYRLNVSNCGPARASNIRVTQFLPDSVRFVRSSPSPIAANKDSLNWQIAQLENGREEALVVTVKLAAFVPQTLFRLISRAHLFATNDTTLANNSGLDTTYVISTQPASQKAKLAVRQFAQTDSFAVSGNDTLRYARAGETYPYFLIISNDSDVLAQNVSLTDFLPDSIRARNFQPAPALIATDSLRWHLGNLTPRRRLSLQFEATVSRFMPFGTNLIINKIRAQADNEDPAQSSSVAVDTVYNFVPPPQPLAPLIEARPAIVNVRDSIFVRVRVLEPIVAWDLWVYLADGRVTTDYADAFIAATPLAPGIWYEVSPPFTNTRLFTTAKQEPIRFELRTRNTFGLAASDTATVIVQSNNAMVLDRNVFEADREGPLAINFRLSSNRRARLDVYDLAGHHVTTLAENNFFAGWNTFNWNGTIAENGYQAGSGVYLITLRSGEYDDWKKVIIVR